MKLTPIRWILAIGLALVVLVALIQLVPFGKTHDNPPVTTQIAWDSPRTEELVRGACYDCHSNETVWPWYSHVAPVSWLLQLDVTRGREELNFSTWTPEMLNRRVGEMVEVISENRMAPPQYTAIHASARLSVAEKQDLISGLQATFK
jgi:hypothetical protein